MLQNLNEPDTKLDWTWHKTWLKPNTKLDWTQHNLTWQFSVFCSILCRCNVVSFLTVHHLHPGVFVTHSSSSVVSSFLYLHLYFLSLFGLSAGFHLLRSQMIMIVNLYVKNATGTMMTVLENDRASESKVIKAPA